MPRCYKSFLLFLLVAVLFSCSQEQLLTIEGYYSQAKQAEEQKRIKQALRFYQKLLTHYPRSKYTKEVQLKIADMQYDREDYIDALADYKIYQKYYESVDEAEYIQYRVASCYFYARLAYDRDQTMLKKAIDEYKNLRHKITDIWEAVASAFACKAAIKSGDPLNLMEMASLMDQLFATREPYFCPHGRPIIINLPLEELDKRFGR